MHRKITLGLLALALSACGGDAPTPAAPGPTAPTAATTPAATNRPPIAEIYAVLPPGAALPGVTRVAFGGGGSDPDGDTVSYTWDFGDGTTADGSGASHIYPRPGSFTVTLTASDGHGATAHATRIFEVRSLSGNWTGSVCSGGGGGACVAFNGALTQTGTSFRGSTQSGVSVSGALANERNITLFFSGRGACRDRLNGQVDNDITQIDARSFNSNDCVVTLSR